MEITGLSSKHRMRFLTILISLCIILVFTGEVKIHALHNHVGCHDPSTIVKCDDTYWIFTTGYGPYTKFSKDLVHWTAGKTPLTPGSFPSWVTDYVPDFGGHFWAPDCIYMNGKYYLYYSCSSWGSTVSCIGLLTSESLNPDSPDYEWKDEGVVVYSSLTSNYNCIDPAVMMDDSGKVWMSYGSHWDGIRMVELDSTSGKVSGDTHYSVAGKGDYKTEAPYLIQRGNFYYLFYNRGQCCQGASSTYYIQVGRSTSPTGPFLDKTGKDCYQGGGTTIFSTSGSLIGPGCIGYYVENNTEFVSYHFYDGENSGIAKLGIGSFDWSEDDWPVVTNDWIEDGHYAIMNENSQFVWHGSGSGSEMDPVIQNPYTQSWRQKWTFETLGNGFYKITLGGRELAASMDPCTAIPGTELALLASGSSPCQTWRVEKTNENRLVLSSKYGNRALEVPGSSTDAGTQLEINHYSGSDNQQWTLSDTFLAVSAKPIEMAQSRVKVYPNPLVGEHLFIEFDEETPVNECIIKIISSDGRNVFLKRFKGKKIIRLENNLKPGTYFLTIMKNNHIFSQKLIINPYY